MFDFLMTRYAPILRSIRFMILKARGRFLMASRKFGGVSPNGSIVLLSLGGAKGSPYVANAVDAQGFDLIVCSPDFPIMESTYAKAWLELDLFEDYESLRTQIAACSPVAVLVEQRNILLPIKARLIVDLNLQEYGDLSWRTSTSKIELRKAIDRAKLPNVPWCLFKDYKPGRLPFPYLLKPESGTGSRGITVVLEEQDLVVAIDRMREFEGDETVGGELLLEAMIPGRQFDVEGIYVNGECIPLAFVEEHYEIVDKAVPSAWYLFSPPICDTLRSSVLEHAQLFTRALGVINGAFHCEMRVTAEGEIFVIDYSNRMGYPHLVSENCGYNFPQAYVQSMVGMRPELSSSQEISVFQEYIRTKERFERYQQLLSENPGMLIQKNLAFPTAGVHMVARVALRATSAKQMASVLSKYDLVPHQWQEYYETLVNNP